MGLFKKLKSSFNTKNLNPFTKRGLTSLAYGVVAGPTAYIGSMNDEFRSGLTDTAKGVGNMFSGGAITQHEATEEAKKARDLATQQYAESTAAAEAEASRLANLEEERKKRLQLYGTQTPSTLIGGYLGVTGQPTVGRATLG